jgi:hypothetical protein|tara:strand:+ start:420 stop:749 length:330 start_codon:yes stop_codon:yes gene_type:complete
MNVKQKGNRFELAVARMLRPLFPNVATSRERDRWLDGQGVDLVNTYPFLIQCKHVERGLDPHKVLEHMPEIDGQYNMLLWKRNRKGTLVVMSVEDAEEIAYMLKRENIL